MPAALFSTVPLRTGMSAVGTELAFILRTAFAAGPFIYEVYKKNQYGKYLKDVLDGKYVDKLHHN